MVKLLVPGGAIIDHDEVRPIGQCGFVDWSGTPAPGGRRIQLVSEMRSSELRVNRGGIAIVSAMPTREYMASFRAVRTEVLLLGGRKSPVFLKRVLDDLEKVLQQVTRFGFPGLDHAASWNADRGGRPERVAPELRRLFA